MSGPVSSAVTGAPVYWHKAEPSRFQRDLDEVTTFAPDLVFTAGPGVNADVAHHGVWVGRLPVWPFERPEPEGLGDLVPEGLLCAVWCSAAYPMLPPQIVPIDPEPELVERSQHTWHVSPNGSLCLMQTLGAWEPETSIVVLLIKACSWRIEHALLKAGVVEAMTLRGIVHDDSLDHLIAQAVQANTEAVKDQDIEDQDAAAQADPAAGPAVGENLEATT